MLRCCWSMLGLFMFACPAWAQVFQHGIASGDPLSDRVILWTRITPSATPNEPIAYRWQVARDPELSEIVAEGEGQTDELRDYTVKVDAKGLEAGTDYYYRFTSGLELSPVGHTKTLPALGTPLGSLRLLIASCANYPYGYFHAYRLMAEEKDVDLVLHLGDYIYEYEEGEYGEGKPLQRVPIPATPLHSLADYRMRHAQYKTDLDLQALHAAHAMIPVWDDHEVANDAWTQGAQNHKEASEGPWESRRSAAVRAYHEWMPTRDQDDALSLRSYRSFTFGSLASLSMLDTRLVGRDQQLSDKDPGLYDAKRQLLGSEQEQWLFGELAAAAEAHTAWQLIGQQVMFAPLWNHGRPYSTDQWDGYPAARQRVMEALERNGRDRTLILSGDIHSSWASVLSDKTLGLKRGDPDKVRAVELVTPGITSPSIEQATKASLSASYLKLQNKHIRFADLYHRGYLRLELTPELARARWIFVDQVRSPQYKRSEGASFDIPGGSLNLIEGSGD